MQLRVIHSSLGTDAMKSIYFEDDDILQIRVSDKPIRCETSQDWHTNISYAEDGTIVEIEMLDAKRKDRCRWNTKGSELANAAQEA